MHQPERRGQHTAEERREGRVGKRPHAPDRHADHHQPEQPHPEQIASTSHRVSPVWPSLNGLACLGRRDSRG
jgi:hypothetical protein